MPLSTRQVARLVAVAVPSLAAATLAVDVLQSRLGVPDASSVYLVAVVLTAVTSGTAGAIVAAVAAFLLYDYLYVEPRTTLTVADPGEWLNLVLLLFVGIVVGQLVAIERARTETAIAREREARSLFRVSRALATRDSTVAVLPSIAEALRSETGMDRVWIGLGRDDATEHPAADTGDGPRPPATGLHRVLRRMPGDEPARWVRVHSPGGSRPHEGRGGLHRVRIEAAGRTLGSIWARRPGAQEPDRTETRLLAAAADQLGQAIAHDRLAADAQAAEIARQSDALKSALLQSVSHDLRTPLATIRAAAGTLRPGISLPDRDREASADAIDREVEYLNRLVTNLLDLSRIEAGSLRADRDAFELDDVLGPTIERARTRLGGRRLVVDLDAPAVSVDPVFLDEAVTNVLDNATKYTPPGAAIRLVARDDVEDGYVRLTIEDDGEGVPEAALPRLFDKFYRVPGTPRRSRSGTGIGLAVVRGLVEAMGGRVSARRSELGGLAVDLDLLPAPVAAQVHREAVG